MKKFGGIIALLAVLQLAVAAKWPWPQPCGALCDLDLPGIINYQGYAVEHHSVMPGDRTVVLNMFRIPCGRNGTACDMSKRPPVLLQHGLLDSGTTWIMNPVDDALAFILADAGFDVWIGNNRGNTYSRCQTDACWQFTYDEMGTYDLPAEIYYILEVSHAEKLTYIGHSEGTTQAFAGFSSVPGLQDRVNLFVALAPAVFVNNQRSPLVSFLADFDTVKFIELFGAKEFLPSSTILNTIAKIFCGGGWTTALCEDIIFSLCGVDPEKNHNFNQSRADVYLTHTPAGTSVRNMDHWTQAVRSETFKKYDWGSKETNFEKYGQTTPPIYNLSAVNVPTAVFGGGNDFLADPNDVDRLMSDLRNGTVVYFNFQQDYSHLDFVWAMDAKTTIYPQVLSLVQQYNKVSFVGPLGADKKDE